MPSTDDTAPAVSRRRFITGLGSALAGSLAGCSGKVPGTGPEELDTETTTESDRIVWRYPPRDGDVDGIGYASFEVDRLLGLSDATPMVRLECNSTVGQIAADDPYREFQMDWFRFTIWPPKEYEGRYQYHAWAEPPGQWDTFASTYDITGNVRRFTVELRDLAARGTILVPILFDPGGPPLPDRLHCSMTVQASRPGWVRKSVRVSDTGTLDLPTPESV